VDILDEKQAEDIHLIDIQGLSILADYFIVCSGTSIRLVKALVEAISEELKAQFKLSPRIEGEPQTGWMLLDYGILIVHIFSPERRNYYQLEELWSDGRTLVRLQ
jgi:ribosome-associated protein